MDIRKVSLNEQGIRGAEVHYYEENDRNKLELTKKYPKNPVHLGLEKLFKDLRPYLLETNGYPLGALEEPVRDMFINKTIVHTMEHNSERIVLHGEVEVFEGKSVNLRSPKMQAEDDYENYETLVEIVENIISETKEYLAGNKKVDDKEVVLRWAEARHKEEFTMEMLSSYTPEQLAKMATVIVEKGFGGTIILPQDVADDDEALQGAVEELQTEFPVEEGVELGEVKPKKQKKFAAPIDTMEVPEMASDNESESELESDF